MLFLRTAGRSCRALTALSCIPAGYASSTRAVTYIQGQSPEPRIREYFYYMDHQGQLFLDDTKMKNFVTCLKAACVPIRAGATRRTSPSCLCAAERGTSCAAMTGRWSSPTCCRALRGHRDPPESRSCCRTAAVRRCSPCLSVRRRCSCTPSAVGFITPARSAQGGSAWSGQRWPSRSVPSSFIRQRAANRDSPHTSSGEDRRSN
ncbi:UPF0598 protein C8orf82 homolog isoform X2 [Kryptolebias marmoratus]|uniref:UPF0598 protein C8orf82 homolog isoform X2 n=1 Tax=Kryptolebias marmoratus TaxID=37003 RepID=UPI000D5307AA|nr:UPF0598 protein C8orf82 homolog isoform X2 [Kryptolebias marmoratus]